MEIPIIVSLDDLPPVSESVDQTFSATGNNKVAAQASVLRR